MTIEVREMKPSEFNIVTRYFCDASPEHLEVLGVDPTRLPDKNEWCARYEDQHLLPYEQKTNFFTIWCIKGKPIGFSSLDKIMFGERANMHLHIVESNQREMGVGSKCVWHSVRIYFQQFELKKLYCEPNAFNVAPNRALQRAGFRYLKTHHTVPGPLNFHQAVTRWVLERQQILEDEESGA